MSLSVQCLFVGEVYSRNLCKKRCSQPASPLVNERLICWASQERASWKSDSCLHWKSLPWICNCPVKSSVLHVELLQLNFHHSFKLRERNHNWDCFLDLMFLAERRQQGSCWTQMSWYKSLEQWWTAAGLWYWINHRGYCCLSERLSVFFFSHGTCSHF